MSRADPTYEVSEIVEQMDRMNLSEIKEFFANGFLDDRWTQENATMALAINLAATIAIASRACAFDRHFVALSMLATITASVTAVLSDESEDARLEEKDEARLDDKDESRRARRPRRALQKEA